MSCNCTGWADTPKGWHQRGCSSRTVEQADREVDYYKMLYQRYDGYTQLWAERFRQSQADKRNLARETNKLRKQLYPGKC